MGRSAVLRRIWTTLSRLFELEGPSDPDPIDHPSIRAMTARELADLPLERHPGPGRGLQSDRVVAGQEARASMPRRPSCGVACKAGV